MMDEPKVRRGAVRTLDLFIPPRENTLGRRRLLNESTKTARETIAVLMRSPMEGATNKYQKGEERGRFQHRKRPGSMPVHIHKKGRYDRYHISRLRAAWGVVLSHGEQPAKMVRIILIRPS